MAGESEASKHICKTSSKSIYGDYMQDYKILAKKELCPWTYHLKVSAPLIAKKILAGQFIIIRPNKHSERIPLSICGWNRDEGYIEIIIMACGRTSREACERMWEKSLKTLLVLWVNALMCRNIMVPVSL